MAPRPWLTLAVSLTLGIAIDRYLHRKIGQLELENSQDADKKRQSPTLTADQATQILKQLIDSYFQNNEDALFQLLEVPVLKSLVNAVAPATQSGNHADNDDRNQDWAHNRFIHRKTDVLEDNNGYDESVMSLKSRILGLLRDETNILRSHQFSDPLEFKSRCESLASNDAQFAAFLLECQQFALDVSNNTIPPQPGTEFQPCISVDSMLEFLVTLLRLQRDAFLVTVKQYIRDQSDPLACRHWLPTTNLADFIIPPEDLHQKLKSISREVRNNFLETNRDKIGSNRNFLLGACELLKNNDSLIQWNICRRLHLNELMDALYTEFKNLVQSAVPLTSEPPTSVDNEGCSLPNAEEQLAGKLTDHLTDDIAEQPRESCELPPSDGPIIDQTHEHTDKQESEPFFLSVSDLTNSLRSVVPFSTEVAPCSGERREESPINPSKVNEAQGRIGDEVNHNENENPTLDETLQPLSEGDQLAPSHVASHTLVTPHQHGEADSADFHSALESRANCTLENSQA